MANTYVKIASVSVGAGGAASIDFTAIPATYTDLLLKFSVRTTTNGFRDLRLSFNGNTSSFTNRYLEGSGSAASSGSTAVRYLGTIPGTNVTASTFTNSELYIPNYASSNSKSYSLDATGENNATLNYSTLLAGLWANSAAITSIELTPEPTNTLAQYSSATLYGILKN
jgi:hypothetical protein